ncbi:MAG: hypothetical protein ABSC25_13765 [Roseiarcus sp.]|jgi:serine/threonine-protein kinase RIO1
MQKITVDLIRLAVSGALIGAVVGAAQLRGLHHSDQLANAKIPVPSPIHAKAISVGAPAMCWTTNDRIRAPTMEEAQTEPSVILQTCASVAPALRRHREPASNPQSLLAFAP